MAFYTTHPWLLRTVRIVARFLAGLALSAHLASASNVDLDPHQLPKNCEQFVMVTAPDWSSSNGTLQRYERSGAGKSFQPVGRAVPVLLGRRGLAWDHESALWEKNAPQKKEGDERSPAGFFTLGPAFGRAPIAQLPWLRLPYHQLSPTTEGIDDPASRYYGQIVEREQIAKPDWHSSEHMGHITAYDLGAVINANPEHRPHGGSCIFLHLWMEGWTGTSGCTALHRADLEELLHWLNPAKHPIFIQLPASATEYPKGIGG